MGCLRYVVPPRLQAEGSLLPCSYSSCSLLLLFIVPMIHHCLLQLFRFHSQQLGTFHIVILLYMERSKLSTLIFTLLYFTKASTACHWNSRPPEAFSALLLLYFFRRFPLNKRNRKQFIPFGRFAIYEPAQRIHRIRCNFPHRLSHGRNSGYIMGMAPGSIKSDQLNRIPRPNRISIRFHGVDHIFGVTIRSRKYAVVFLRLPGSSP